MGAFDWWSRCRGRGPCGAWAHCCPAVGKSAHPARRSDQGDSLGTGPADRERARRTPKNTEPRWAQVIGVHLHIAGLRRRTSPHRRNSERGAGIPVLACGGSRASPRNRKTPQASKDIYDSPRVSKRVAGQVRSAKDPSLCLTMGGIDNTLVKQGFERKNGYLTLRRAPKRPRMSSWSSSGSTASTT